MGQQLRWAEKLCLILYVSSFRGESSQPSTLNEPIAYSTLCLVGLDNDIHHRHLRTASLFLDSSAEGQFPGCPRAGPRQCRRILDIRRCDLARARSVVIPPSCTLGLSPGVLHCDTNIALSYSFLTSQRLNRFVWIIFYPAVLFITFSVDQEPSSQDGHGWPRTTKPFFAWQVEQKFRLCSLQTSWVLLARWPWRRHPRQEGSQSRLSKQQRSIVLGYPEPLGNSHAGVSFGIPFMCWAALVPKVPHVFASLYTYYLHSLRP